MQLKEIETSGHLNNILGDESENIINDTQYICKSCSLITESLQRGFDVLQLANGDVVVTELKPVTFHYTWDSKKGKMVRQQSNDKSKKLKLRKKA